MQPSFGNYYLGIEEAVYICPICSIGNCSRTEEQSIRNMAPHDLRFFFSKKPLLLSPDYCHCSIRKSILYGICTRILSDFYTALYFYSKLHKWLFERKSSFWTRRQTRTKIIILSKLPNIYWYPLGVLHCMIDNFNIHIYAFMCLLEIDTQYNEDLKRSGFWLGAYLQSTLGNTYHMV